MSRRLLKVKGNKALYVNTEPGIGSWVAWEPLPRRPDLDPAARLLAEATPKVTPIGGLYDGRSEEQRRSDTRRAADRVLEKYKVIPPKTW